LHRLLVAGLPAHCERFRTLPIASILLRQRWDDEHFDQLGSLLQGMMNREAIRHLRRALKPRTDEDMQADNREQERRWQALWLREHPGRTRADYARSLRDGGNGEVWRWRDAKVEAAMKAEREAWERDHPGQEYPEHPCGLTNREYSDYGR
jgi:hypothetical protein